MEGQRLILKDGTRIEGGRAGFSGGFLWLWFTGMTLPEAAGVFLNPEKTGKIVFQYGEMEDVYEDFTNCTNLMIGTDGQVSVCLTRGNGDV